MTELLNKMSVYYTSCCTVRRQCGVDEGDVERQTQVEIQLSLLLGWELGQMIWLLLASISSICKVGILIIILKQLL